MDLKLIVGLGNPGEKYVRSRHNIGADLVWMLAPGRKKKFVLRKDSLVCECEIEGEETALALPQTFMNLSGRAVGELLEEYKVELPDLMVVVDDLHLPFGRLRLRPAGSDGGHNGLKSVVEWLETENFPRLRVGIQPEKGIGKDWAEFVLDDFSKNEMKELEEVGERVRGLVGSWIQHGIEKTMSQYNAEGGK